MHSSSVSSVLRHFHAASRCGAISATVEGGGFSVRGLVFNIRVASLCVPVPQHQKRNKSSTQDQHDNDENHASAQAKFVLGIGVFLANRLHVPLAHFALGIRVDRKVALQTAESGLVPVESACANVFQNEWSRERSVT